MASTTSSQVAESKSEGKSWIDYIQKDLPEHLDWWPYTLGAIPLTLFGFLVTTGLLLTPAKTRAGCSPSSTTVRTTAATCS